MLSFLVSWPASQLQWRFPFILCPVLCPLKILHSSASNGAVAGHLQWLRCIWWLARSHLRLQPGIGSSVGTQVKSFGHTERMDLHFVIQNCTGGRVGRCLHWALLLSAILGCSQAVCPWLSFLLTPHPAPADGCD